MLSFFAIAAVGLSGSRAEAACNPDPPSDDDAVVCDGNDSTGFDGSGATMLTITTDGVTVLDESGALDSAILVSDDNTVTLGTDATVNVTEADGFGVRGGDRNTITNDGAIIVDGARGVGISVNDGADVAFPGTSPIVTNNGTITINGTDGRGIQSNDNHDLTNAASGTITVGASATDGVGIEAANDNIVINAGTIVVDGARGRAISAGENTGLPLPNGVILEGTSAITINGLDGIAVELGNNAGAIVDGTVDLAGDNSIGLSVGDKSNDAAEANLTSRGVINVDGNNAFGIRVGDGWLDGSFVDDDQDPGTPDVFQAESPGTRNFGDINVAGDNSVGIFAGDSNSFVGNGGTISVTGAGSRGVSLGGNDFLPRGDPDNPAPTDFVFSFVQGSGTITGDEDAGPLVEFRTFSGLNENRLSNPAGSSILADLTNQGVTDRGIAIRGTNGSEFIFNGGDLTGDVQLLGGDDRFAVNAGSTFTGTVFGGAGTDEVLLGFTSSDTPEVFDLGNVDGFERVSIDGRTSAGTSIGWSLAGADQFDGVAEVVAGGRLAILADTNGDTQEILLGGDLEVDPLGSIRIVADGAATAPLRVTGTAQLDGELVLEISDRLTAAGSYRLIDAAGGRGGSEFASETFASRIGLLSFDTEYDVLGLRLEVTAAPNFAAVAESSNLRSIAAHIDAINADGTGDPELQTEITALFGNTGNLNDVFEAFSPEAYDTQTTLIVDGHRRIANVLIDRPRDCTPGELDPWQASNQPITCNAKRFSLWLAPFGSFRDRDAFTGHPEYDSKIGGLVLGIDTRPIGDLELTFAVSSQRGQITVDSRGQSDLVLADLSAHASWARAGFRLQSVLTGGFGSHNSRRRFRFQSNDTTAQISRQAEDDHTSQHVSVAGEAGYLVEVGAIDIEPLVGFNYAWVNQGSVRESGAGSFGVRVDSREYDIASVNGGFRLSTVYQHEKFIGNALLWMDGVWRANLDVRWRQTLTGYDRELTARLIGSPDTVSSFTIEGKEDQGGFEIGAGLSFVPKVANRLEFQFNYDAYRASHTVAHDLVAKVRLGF